MTVKLAVLDMDGTLFDGFLIADVVRLLASTPGCDTASARAALDTIHRYRNGVITHDQCAADVYTAYGRAVAGLPVTVMQDVAAQVWDRARSGLFAHAAPLVTLLRAQGMTVHLLSGSPQDVIRQAAGALGIDHFCGLTMATQNGRLLNLMLRAPALRGAKRGILDRATRGIAVDWEQSFAMGDSSADIEVLQRVGHAVAFEPDAALRLAAVEHGWPVADRHDVLTHCQALLQQSR
jgi:phosphoserine phosphatase